MAVDTILLIAALIAFALAALNVTPRQVSLVPLGLAFLTAALLLPRVVL